MNTDWYVVQRDSGKPGSDIVIGGELDAARLNPMASQAKLTTAPTNNAEKNIISLTEYIIQSKSKSKYFYFTRIDHSVYTCFQWCSYINSRTIYKTRHTHVMIKDVSVSVAEGLP